MTSRRSFFGCLLALVTAPFAALAMRRERFEITWQELGGKQLVARIWGWEGVEMAEKMAAVDCVNRHRLRQIHVTVLDRRLSRQKSYRSGYFTTEPGRVFAKRDLQFIIEHDIREVISQEHLA